MASLMQHQLITWLADSSYQPMTSENAKTVAGCSPSEYILLKFLLVKAFHAHRTTVLHH